MSFEAALVLFKAAVEPCDETNLHWLDAGDENYGDRRGHRLDGQGRRAIARGDHRRSTNHKIGSQRREPIVLTLGRGIRSLHSCPLCNPLCPVLGGRRRPKVHVL